ncbi:hypothetical protein SAMN05444156_3176 [Verrucomicrobium sp. GAS474]|nr:hypothetical protein [Verrucomicrobium sp. GAS474]SDU30319.1 hypothetical protein SAMN05444156_3176 [Verrucomicrobium sp. GAS474]
MKSQPWKSSSLHAVMTLSLLLAFYLVVCTTFYLALSQTQA